MSETYRELVIPAEIERLPEVLSFLEEQMEAACCPMKAQMQICVAAEEVFVNIASYAYAPGTGKAVIRVEVRQDPAEAEITFIEHG